MQSAWRIAVFGMAFVVAILAWNLVVRVFLINTVASPSAVAEGEFFKMQREAQAAHKELPAALAASRYANEKAAKELAAATSKDERAFKAAQIFIGFYLVNARARADFCKEQRVDISNFVGEFTRMHQFQYDRAAGLLKAHGTSVDGIWSTTRAAMARAVEQDMWPAGSAGMTMTEACEEIARRPRTYADKLDFVNRLPEVQRALMDS